jgi:hypothetical protein
MKSNANAVLDAIGFILFLFPVVSYIIILRNQSQNIRAETRRLQVLTARTGLFLPYYAFMLLISLWAPDAYPFLLILITMMEGYSFYCFFLTIVENLGGPAKIVEIMKESTKDYFCCGACCPPDKTAFYKKATWSMFYLLFVRTVIQILCAICIYSGSKAGKVLDGLLSLVNTVILLYALIHVVLICKLSNTAVCRV